MTTTPYLYLDKVDHQELAQLLLTYFGNAQTTVKGFRYHKEGIGFLEIEIDKEERVSKIILSSDFPKLEVDGIKKKIEETLIKNQVPKIGQSLCFTYTKISGYFRYKDMFQVLPVPKDAPQPLFSAGDNPFILQFAYISCSDAMIDNMRRNKQTTIYIRLLNLFSNSRIFSNPRNTAHHWVLNTDDNKELRAEFLQEGYYIKGMGAVVDKYNDLKALSAIQRIEANNYYAKPKARYPEPFIFPDNLEQSLDIAFDLSQKEWKKFFMACSWYYLSSDIWQGSGSAAFIALVSGLECLADKPETCKECNQVLPEKRGVCPRCSQPVYGITRSFRELLEQYVPFIDKMPAEKKLIYTVRSQLAHGLDLLHWDLEPWNFVMSIKAQEQGSLHRALHFITGTAIYNWLWDRHKTQHKT